MPQLVDEGPLWNAQDVAEYLKASRSWVYHRAESGQLPSLRIGGLLRFNPEVIRAYARGERTAAGNSPNASAMAGFPRSR